MKPIVLSAPNKKPAFAMSTETGNLAIVSKDNAALFIESAINGIRKVSGDKYLEFKTSKNTFHQAEIDYLVYVIENRLMKVLEPKLGFLPQDMSAICIVVTHVCNKEQAIRNFKS